MAVSTIHQPVVESCVQSNLGISVTGLGNGKWKLKSTFFDLEPFGVRDNALIGRPKGKYLKLQDPPNSVLEVYWSASEGG